MPIPFHNLGLEQNLKPGDPSLDYRGQWHRQHQPRLEQSAYRCSQSLPIAALVVESDNSLPSGLLLPIGVDHSLGVTLLLAKNLVDPPLKDACALSLSSHHRSRKLPPFFVVWTDWLSAEAAVETAFFPYLLAKLPSQLVVELLPNPCFLPGSEVVVTSSRGWQLMRHHLPGASCC